MNDFDFITKVHLESMQMLESQYGFTSCGTDTIPALIEALKKYVNE